MGNIKKHANEFEKISTAIVEYLLKDTEADITETEPTKDGGYDIVVRCKDGYATKTIFFECKLRKGNLNLRDIAANIIIAFNHGAIALVAITNYNFTQQVGEELEDFCQNTILNIKLIIGEEIKCILDKSNINISKELYDYIDCKNTLRKSDFAALRINLDEDFLQQIYEKENCNQDVTPKIEELFSNEISCLSTKLERSALVCVTGYFGVGKDQIIQEALKKVKKRAITIDATLYETKDLVVLEMLAQIWGLPGKEIFMIFKESDIKAITNKVGEKNNEKEIIELLTPVLKDSSDDKTISAYNNVLLVQYLLDLMKLHINDIGFVIYIKRLQAANQEIYRFLIYFIKNMAHINVGCVISYQIPEYELQEGNDIQKSLQFTENYEEYHIGILSQKRAEQYLQLNYPCLSPHIIERIIAKMGTRFYNLSCLLKSIIPENGESTVDEKILLQRLQNCMSNDIPNLLFQILSQYRSSNHLLFEICYLFECQIPFYVWTQFDEISNKLDFLIDAGIFSVEQGTLIAQNEIVEDWIMENLKGSSGVLVTANKLIKKLSPDKYSIGYTNIYRVLGRNEEALAMLDKNLDVLKKEKQYSSLQKGLIRGIEMADSLNNGQRKIKYIIDLLEILTIQKEIVTDKAEEYLKMLKSCSGLKEWAETNQQALDYFNIKRAFKLGTYILPGDSTFETAEEYYKKCMQKKLINNTDDWIGRICSCYALLIKTIRGNHAALKVFKNIWKLFPDSFEIRREYLSHIACMQLADQPLKAFGNYQRILELFEKEASDSAALPFHEYGDLAMSQLLAQNLEEARRLANNAIEIMRANGITDEEGRCLNIRGCIEWNMGELSSAESSFHEARSIMEYTNCTHYLWRSQLNLLQLSLIMKRDSSESSQLLLDLYNNFLNLYADKIHALAEYDEQTFRKAKEYYALLILGILFNKIMNDKKSYLKICKDFNLGKYKEVYKKDIDLLLSGYYTFIDSPYVQNDYIFFVG